MRASGGRVCDSKSRAYVSKAPTRTKFWGPQRPRFGGMKRSKPQEIYDSLMESFREAPGNVSRAARHAECDRRTARRAWEEGWPDAGLRSCKVVVEEEQAEARARLKDLRAEELAEIAREKERRQELADRAAREDAVTSRLEEAQTVRAARHNAMALLVTTQRMLRAGNKLAEKVETSLAEAVVKPATAVSLFREMATTARAANETAKLAIAMERVLLGDPEKVVEHRHTMDLGAAEREIEAANRALVRARDRGLLVGDTEGKEILPSGT